MTHRFLLASALACLLSACGDEPRDAVPAAPDEVAAEQPPLRAEAEASGEASEPDARVVAVSDVLGTFEGTVSGLAFWEHPTLSFASAVIATNGEAGLAVIPVDREVEGSVTEGTFGGPVAVGYTQEVSYVAAASGTQVALFTVGDDRTLTRVGSVEAEAGALCMVGDALLVVSREATVYRVTPEGTAETLATLPASPEAGCAATAERFYLSEPDGPLRSFAPDGGRELVDDAYAGVPAEALTAVSTPSGPALLYLVRGELVVDGPGLAHAPVTVTQDGAPLPAPGVMAAGSGNFGSLYRDGAVAMISDGELVLLPWAGIARAAGLGEAEAVSLRPREAVTQAPTLQIELPEIEAAAPPAQE